MKLRIIAIAVSICTVLSFVGCKKAPEASIVTNKDFSKLIDDALTSGENVTKPEELAGKYETYKTTVSDETLGVTVKVDAKVNIPTVDKMSILRVSQQEISQELLDKVIAEFFIGEQLCDGSKTKIETKSYFEEQIKHFLEVIEEAKDSGNEDRLNQYQKLLDEYETLYENAPDDIDFTSYPHDGRLHSVEEKYKSNPDDPYYSWLYSLAPEGNSIYAISDGKNGCYETVVAYNTSDYANQIRYTRTYDTYSGAGLMELISDYKTKLPESDESEEPELKLSKDEAIAKAEEALKHLEISGFAMYSCDKYIDDAFDMYINEHAPSSNETDIRQKYYILTYIRKIGGAFVLTGEEKFADGWQGNQYNKQVWPDESIVFCINDDGIVGFAYNFPITITETVVENASVKSFETIKASFEKMMPISYASTNEHRVISIDTVSFGYARISEANSFDTGLLVPVWDFIGASLYNGKPDIPDKMTYMTINGIDGSVIDRQLGY